MNTIDLNALSLNELKQLQKDVGKAIATYEDRQKAEARAELEAKAKELGYNLADLVSLELKKKRAPVSPKYRHPEDPSITWTGRGRKPLWVVAALEAGATLETLEI